VHQDPTRPSHHLQFVQPRAKGQKVGDDCRKGYVGHDAPKPLRVYRSGQKRGVFGQIKKELRRRAAIEPVIGHLKSDGHLGRNYLKGRHGDQANAVLTATGHNLRLVLRWLRKLLCKFIATLIAAIAPVSELKTAS
jgi:IS5 family transposase